MELGLHSLFRLEVSVDDTEAVQVVQAQGQLSQVELHVLLCEHHLHQAGAESAGAGGTRPSAASWA